MKTKVQVLGFTSEGLTIVELSNANYDAIVLYNEDTLEVECEIEFNEYLSLEKVDGEFNNPTLGDLSKSVVEQWFKSHTVLWDNL